MLFKNTVNKMMKYTSQKSFYTLSIMNGKQESSENLFLEVIFILLFNINLRLGFFIYTSY